MCFTVNREFKLLKSRTTTGTDYIYSDSLEACNTCSQERLLVSAQACRKLMLGTQLMCMNR